MRRFNQFTYFLKIIIHLFHAYISLYVVQKVVVQTLEVTGSQVWYV